MLSVGTADLLNLICFVTFMGFWISFDGFRNWEGLGVEISIISVLFMNYRK